MKKISLKTISPTYYLRIIESSKKVPRSNKILDAGCSDGYLDYLIKNKGDKIYGIDVNKSDLEIAKILNPNSKYQVASLYKLPFDNSYFDVVMCLDVLEHLQNDNKALDEIKRVLKKKGKLILTVPSENYPFVFDPINYLLKFFNTHIRIGMWGFGHKRLYNMQKLQTKLKKIGFKIKYHKYLSHTITGLFENSYLINMVQPLTKSDPLNKEDRKTDTKKLRKRLTKKPAKILTKVRDMILYLDNLLFRHSKTSINLLIVAEKQG